MSEMQTSPLIPDGRNCACGALAHGTGRRCLKCRYRARWRRRKARKH
jgi:hypothetical protein